MGLRLLTESEYRNSIRDIFGSDILVQGRFDAGRRVGGLLATSSTVLSVTPAGLESFSKMADSIASQVVDQKHREKLVGCAPNDAKAADDACANAFLARSGRLLFRRPLTTDELKSRVKLAGELAKSNQDFYVGLSDSLATLLYSPTFLFRHEIAVPRAGRNTRWTVTAAPPG